MNYQVLSSVSDASVEPLSSKEGVIDRSPDGVLLSSTTEGRVGST